MIWFNTKYYIFFWNIPSKKWFKIDYKLFSRIDYNPSWPHSIRQSSWLPTKKILLSVSLQMSLRSFWFQHLEKTTWRQFLQPQLLRQLRSRSDFLSIHHLNFMYLTTCLSHSHTTIKIKEEMPTMFTGSHIQLLRRRSLLSTMAGVIVSRFLWA